MSKQKEIRNESVLPDAEIERLAKMLMPSIYDAWERETAAAQQTNENKIVHNQDLRLLPGCATIRAMRFNREA